MRLGKLGTALALTLVTAASTSAFAQNASMKAQLDAVREDVEELKKIAAATPTIAQAVQELSSKVVILEQRADAEANGQVREELVVELDRLRQEVTGLLRDVEYLRTDVANIEQPAAITGGGGVGHGPDGFRFASADGRYTLNLGGYLQPRYDFEFSEDFSSLDRAGVSLRRSRLRLGGQLGDRLSYLSVVELTAAVPLLEFYGQFDFNRYVGLRAGQSRVAFTRSFQSVASERAFHEFSLAQDGHRYDRDLGVSVVGRALGDRLRYEAGIWNGAGINRANDNIDSAVAARVDVVALGDFIEPGFGDVQGTEQLALTVGAGAVHDLVRLPTEVAGIELGNRDVNQDGVVDNVRVLSSTLYGQLRFQGWDFMVEGTWRHERWGTILDQADNGQLEDAVDPSGKGRRNYLGVTGAASYFVIPHKLLVGARVSHGRLPLLGVSGRSLSAPPPAERALQLDALVQLYRQGRRALGFSYGFTNYNAVKDEPDPVEDKGHTFIFEAQFAL